MGSILTISGNLTEGSRKKGSKMCEGRSDEKLTQVILDQLSDQPDDSLVEEMDTLSTFVDNYLGDNWGLGFGERPHFD